MPSAVRRAEVTRSHHLGVAGVLHAQCFFQRVGVVGVDLELDVVLFDPGSAGVDIESRILMRHLLEADHDLHGERASGEWKNPGRACPGDEKRCKAT